MACAISVIIPVYNVAPYLRECLDSLVCQTFTDFEVICVDDGSSDESPAIVASYTCRDPRFRLICQDNAGVSAARNAGIEYAVAPLVTFVDSDDYVHENYLQRLLEPFASEEYDLVTSGLVEFDASGTLAHNRMTDRRWCLNKETDYVDFRSMPYSFSPVGKVYRKSIIDKLVLRFNTDISYAEDKEFNFRYLSGAALAYTIDYCGYYYRRGLPSSLSVRPGNENKLLEHSLAMWALLYTDSTRRGFFTGYAECYLVRELVYMINDYIYSMAKRYSISYCASMFSKVDLSAQLAYLRKHSAQIDLRKPIKTLLLGNFTLALACIYKIL